MYRIVFIFATLLAGSAQLPGNPVDVKHASVALIAEESAVVPGRTLQLALHFELESKWHIYWKNPGASGLPVEIEWDLPSGFEAGAIRWPAPHRIEMAGLVNYGYEEAVTLMVPVTIPEDLPPGETVRLQAEAFWLICKEVCLPDEASLGLELPVAAEAAPGEHAARFAAARESLPDAEAPWATSGFIEAGQLHLQLQAAGATKLPESLYFFAGSEGVVDPNAAQSFAYEGPTTAVLSAALATAFDPESPPELIEGVLQSERGNWTISVPLGRAAAPPVGTSGPAEADPQVPGASGLEGQLLDFGLPGWLLLAFLGGLILNIMPCVLPVLSLKVFSLLKHVGQSRRQALAHGLAYTGGVVASFLALAVSLFALRAFGEQVGWGFQLQNPGFVVALTVLFFVFGLNLMGVFEIGSSLVGADANVSQRRDLAGSAGTGVLAAVVGAPCVGPFVGGVSGIALQAATGTGLLLFGMLGFGMAFPFLVLAVFPKLVSYLPKPGPWMEAFKQSMGFLLMAAVVFLAWVAGSSGGVDAILTLLIVLFVCGVACWIYGRWGAPSRSRRSRRLALAITLLLTLGGGVWGGQMIRESYRAAAAEGKSAAGAGAWAAWSKDRVAAELEAGNPVFVDFTATWCLICQVNKKTALRTDSTKALFEDYGIVPMEADWTRYDAAITKELERYGRSGVPLYLLHVPGGETVVLPQNLTHGIIRDAVANAL